MILEENEVYMCKQEYLNNNFIFQVFWEMNNSFTYMYGANVKEDSDSVCYCNPLMAPATKIHTWYSETSYPNFRFSPTLPLLRNQSEYLVFGYYEDVPQKSIFIQIDFFNKFGNKIAGKISDTHSIKFVFPDKATNYQISLVNTSNKSLNFQKIIIMETTSKVTNVVFDWKHESIVSSSSKLNEH